MSPGNGGSDMHSDAVLSPRARGVQPVRGARLNPAPLGPGLVSEPDRSEVCRPPGLHARCCQAVGGPLASARPALHVSLNPSRDGGGCGRGGEKGPGTGPIHVGPLERVGA